MPCMTCNQVKTFGSSVAQKFQGASVKVATKFGAVKLEQSVLTAAGRGNLKARSRNFKVAMAVTLVAAALIAMLVKPDLVGNFASSTAFKVAAGTTVTALLGTEVLYFNGVRIAKNLDRQADQL
ncbi:hypothetical protein SCG7109_AN_00130 [Chlamydiales bacterium SCGC AG-110-M15]|nr:hypothetical protein SCG7109_AN_00130 [Chlamydiales bacterium SCGC AG-110-M15]